MRSSLFVLLAATTVLSIACDQPQDPETPQTGDSTVVNTTWEKIDLVPNASAQVFAINDEGTIVGRMGDSAHPNSLSHAFVYENGVVRAFVSDSDAFPGVISPRGEIVGVAGNTVVVVWDSAAAVPRRLDAEPALEDANLAVVAVNEPGDIVAVQVAHDAIEGHGKALLWRNGVRQNLGFLAVDSSNIFGHPSTFATALNSRGQIVGRGKVALVVHLDTPPGEVFHPFIWENGVMRDLGVLGHHPCENVATPLDCAFGTATDINADGVVVGDATGPGGLQRAFIWENGVMRDLGVYPGQNTRAMAINDRGQILGLADTMAFLWENGETQTITGADHASPRALGAHGEVIGSIRVTDHISHTFIWKAGHLTDLGVGNPIAINSQGDIIGNWYHQDGGTQAILWRKKRA